jgi:hypothetical protein
VLCLILWGIDALIARLTRRTQMTHA